VCNYYKILLLNFQKRWFYTSVPEMTVVAIVNECCPVSIMKSVSVERPCLHSSFTELVNANFVTWATWFLQTRDKGIAYSLIPYRNKIYDVANTSGHSVANLPGLFSSW
jgi:hypothetical protein